MKHKTAYLGMSLALALILSYVEALIPFHFGIPGIKLGLANLITVVMLCCVGAKEAFVVSVLRIVLAGFLFGNPFGILYGLSGGLLSFFVMYLLWRTKKLHVISVSVTGGIFHNIGQLAMAAAVVENKALFYYLPVLLAAGFATGLLIGILAQEMILRVKRRM